MRFAKSLSFAAVLMLGLTLSYVTPAFADRASSIFDLVMRLNGSPSSPAEITTATGADVDSAPISSGACISIQCTTETYVLPGITVTATGSTRGILVGADAPPWQMCLKRTETRFSTLAKTTAGTCGYWVMQ